jgi:hypothetical protein
MSYPYYFFHPWRTHTSTQAEFFDENPDKSLESFTPCYSQSCLEIYISSSSRNLLQLFELLYTVKKKGGKPDRKPYPLLYGLKNPHINLKSANSQAQETSTKFYVHEFGFCTVHHLEYCSRIFKQSMRSRNRVGIGLSYRSARWMASDIIHCK